MDRMPTVPLKTNAMSDDRVVVRLVELGVWESGWSDAAASVASIIPLNPTDCPVTGVGELYIGSANVGISNV